MRMKKYPSVKCVMLKVKQLFQKIKVILHFKVISYLKSL